MTLGVIFHSSQEPLQNIPTLQAFGLQIDPHTANTWGIGETSLPGFKGRYIYYIHVFLLG